MPMGGRFTWRDFLVELGPIVGVLLIWLLYICTGIV